MSGARQPRPMAPARIAPLATLPLFHKLDGRKVVLAGSSEGAVWKAELLAAAGAELSVFAPDGPEAFATLASGSSAGRVRVLARRWRPEDLEGAALAVADAEDDEEAAGFAAAARRAGAVVNVIDRPAFCDAQFGALVNRSPLVVAISTDGAAPVFGQAIRAKIEALLPAGLKGWAEAARDWRPFVQARRLGFAARRAFWEAFTARALAAPGHGPGEADRTALMAALDGIEATPRAGRVTLVGAGPGDPDLLTLKAVRALQAADVILYDDLVSGEVLELARREARRMLVGKTGHGPSCSQAEINRLMVGLAGQGRHVVRLKGGDPLVFGRATEEIEACEAAGLPVEIVPGITAAQGAAAALKLSLTERRHARRVQFLTGHGVDGELPADIVWPAVSDPSATTILYMPRRTLGLFAERAQAAGLSPATPALAVSAATRPTQEIVTGTLATLPALIGVLPRDEPLLVMIGAVTRRAGRLEAGSSDAAGLGVPEVGRPARRGQATARAGAGARFARA